MEVRLCTNLSENNKIGKNILELARVECTLKDETSIINPSILYAGDYPAGCNYLYIYAFSRWYFVKNITSVRNGVWRIDCHVDVLESNKETIKLQEAVVLRQEYNWNLYLNDGFFRTYQNPGFTKKLFPNHFDNSNNKFILITAGYGTPSS